MPAHVPRWRLEQESDGTTADTVAEVPSHAPEWHPGRRLIALFLWLTIAAAALGIYLYRIQEVWTILLVMLTSLFLGLLTFALMTDHVHFSGHELPAASREPDPVPDGSSPTDRR
ncbi:MAG TPA: hypothetical protein VFB34_11915 [Chloroflexota bacterium]|nr:hypothetical protein [Chloroflexota bacterium]